MASPLACFPSFPSWLQGCVIAARTAAGNAFGRVEPCGWRCWMGDDGAQECQGRRAGKERVQSRWHESAQREGALSHWRERRIHFTHLSAMSSEKSGLRNRPILGDVRPSFDAPPRQSYNHHPDPLHPHHTGDTSPLFKMAGYVSCAASGAFVSHAARLRELHRVLSAPTQSSVLTLRSWIYRENNVPHYQKLFQKHDGKRLWMKVRGIHRSAESLAPEARVWMPSEGPPC